jgi:hypothetical protein
MEFSQLGPQSQPSFSVPPDTNAYYRLFGGAQATNVQTVIALSLSNHLVAPQPPANAAQFFYRAQRIALAAPHDSDGDGIDDLWELANGLDPLNPGDAAQFTPSDTRTWLEVYTDQQAVTFDYQYPLTQSATFETLAQDPLSGTVYAAGYTTTSDGTNHALVLKSSDGGINWQTDPPFLDYPLGTNGGDYLSALAVDASGNIYAAGQTFDPKVELIVLKGVGGGRNWSLSDRYSGESRWGTIKAFDFVSAAADRDGNVYVAARAYESKTYCQQCPGIQIWFVRKFTPSSNSWATVDGFLGNYGTWPTAVACDPAGRVFVVGMFAASLGNYGWAVRSSLDGGASWRTVDTFQLEAPANMEPTGVKTDAKGNVYVVGNGFMNGLDHWLVRASTDGGNTWKTIDDPPLEGNGATARSIGVDSAGRLNVRGNFADTSNVGHSLLRRSSDGGATWVNVDDLTFGAVDFISAISMQTLPDGSTLAGGFSTFSPPYDWRMRRLPPPPPK